MKKVYVVIITLVLVFATACQQTNAPEATPEADAILETLSTDHVVFVDKDAANRGNNDGSSWNTAFQTLQDALICISAGSFDHCDEKHEIWVAAGMYFPDEANAYLGPQLPPSIFNGNRSAAFNLRVFGELDITMQIYGGFDGVGFAGIGGTRETSRSQRDPEQNETILSGDINQNGSGNSFHVVNAQDVTSDTVLDGFTIEAGRAENGNGVTETQHKGGGMLCHALGNLACSPSLANLRFRDNKASEFGGALAIFAEQGGTAEPSLQNIQFEANQADTGGAISIEVSSNLNAESNVTLDEVTFLDNFAEREGGAIWTEEFGQLTLSVKNTYFLGNSADGNNPLSAGGAINMFSISLPKLTLDNVVFSGNTSFSAAAVVLTGSQGLPLRKGAPPAQFRNVSFNENVSFSLDAADSPVVFTEAWVKIVNSVMWHNKSLNGTLRNIRNNTSSVRIGSSNIQGGFNGAGMSGGSIFGLVLENPNINARPKWVRRKGNDGILGTADDNLRLRGNSPNKDAGSNSQVHTSTDITGCVDRILNNVVDIGAYETQTTSGPIMICWN